MLFRSGIVRGVDDAPIERDSTTPDVGASPVITDSSPVSRPDLEKVIAYGGIEKPTSLGLRYSKRQSAQHNADSTVMESRDLETMMPGTIYRGRINLKYYVP